MSLIRNLKTCLVALMMATGLLASPAFAATLYGYDSSGQLITINQSTGATTTIGATQGGRVGLAMSTATNIAYTRSFSQLFSVNLATGANTLLGASGSSLTGLTFNATQTTLYSVDQSTGSFYSISLANGTPTLIGSTGVTSMLDLATNAAGTVYGVDISGKIYTINTGTGAATLVTQLAAEGLTAIEFTGSGDLIGIGLNSDQLYSGLLTTPVAGAVLNPRFTDVRGLLLVGDAVAGVPEPATWALMILGFGGIGFAMRRRPRQAIAIA